MIREIIWPRYRIRPREPDLKAKLRNAAAIFAAENGDDADQRECIKGLLLEFIEEVTK